MQKLKLLALVATTLSLGNVMAQKTTEPEVKYYVETGLESDFKFDNLSQYIYLNLSFSGPFGYKITPELNTGLAYRAEEVNDFSISHKYLRFNLSKSKFAKVAGKDLGMNFRYTAPTSRGAQTQGSVGSISVRPSMGFEMGPVSLTVRNSVGFFLQRSAYQIHDKTKGNPIFGDVLELLGSSNLTEELSLAYNVFGTWTLNDKPLGGKDRTWTNNLSYEVGVGYSVKKFADVRVTVSHSSDYGTGTDVVFFDSDNLGISFTLSREF